MHTGGDWVNTDYREWGLLELLVRTEHLQDKHGVPGMDEDGVHGMDE